MLTSAAPRSRARREGVPLWSLRSPPLPNGSHLVEGRERRMVEPKQQVNGPTLPPVEQPPLYVLSEELALTQRKS